ncbi:RNA polymerase sigma factor [Paenibacillus sp. GCM10023248]|uniref:RNA polymerase sigma factor n=1 Tax=Bacillales TaxID=1385 RepID=UPI0023798C08|nr:MULTISPECIES: sigma-70 family RNA polymerase sigma factor [Bacillales]MDD9271996.1 sigma-70 family RNA polymerase sigma factor [Paenibacillus sp. MAHUQ-63]MDR6883589.1 RNA polymerase sigma factor (sigma-70 family) [Bacillus sp. 3255]
MGLCAGVGVVTFVYSCGEEEKHIQERELVERILNGDQAAFRELVATYRQYLFQTIYAIVRHTKDAEDLSQDVWSRIYFSLPQYQMKGLKTWMTRIAVNRAIDFKRSASRRREEVTAEMEDSIQADPTAGPYPSSSHSVEQEVMTRETTELVRRKLHQIPANYHEVLTAYYIHHQSYQDIAAANGVTVKTVESKLYRAKQWLRNNWKEEDFL